MAFFTLNPVVRRQRGPAANKNVKVTVTDMKVFSFNKKTVGKLGASDGDGVAVLLDPVALVIAFRKDDDAATRLVTSAKSAKITANLSEGLPEGFNLAAKFEVNLSQDADGTLRGSLATDATPVAKRKFHGKPTQSAVV